MIRHFMIAGMSIAALNGAAQAASKPTDSGAKQTSVCLEVSGRTLPVVCRVPASRLNTQEDICTCPQGVRVDVAVCGPNETPPAEGRALSEARSLAAKDGSLIGDQFKGQPLCAAPAGR